MYNKNLTVRIIKDSKQLFATRIPVSRPELAKTLHER